MARTKASLFYDGYHQKSAERNDEDPVVLKTYWIHRAWLAQLKPAPGSRLLDLSCGLGHFLKAAHDHDASLRLEGLDHSEFACREARARVPKAKIKRGDALRTGYPSNHFDAVTCLGSLEHYPDSLKGAQEIYRILKPGGKALIYVPNLFFLGYIYFAWKRGETPHEAGQNEYEHFETRQGWEALVQKAGFKVTDITKHNEMFATQRVSALVKLGYSLLLEPFVPLNLSYCFGFWVEKPVAEAAKRRKR